MEAMFRRQIPAKINAPINAATTCVQLGGEFESASVCQMSQPPTSTVRIHLKTSSPGSSVRRSHRYIPQAITQVITTMVNTCSNQRCSVIIGCICLERPSAGAATQGNYPPDLTRQR